MKHLPFETVEEARRVAARRLPSAVRSLLGGGNQAGVSAKANVDIFNHVHLRSRPCAAPASLNTTVRVAGLSAALPLMVAPVAAQGIAPGAEIGQARACAAAGIPLAVSNFASVPWHELTSQGAEVLAQLYWVGERADMAQRLEHARSAGVRTIVLTVDWSFPAGRDWGTPAMPKSMGWREALDWAPAAISRPGWFAPFVSGRALPPLKAPNFADVTDPHPTFPAVMARWKNTAPLRWEDVGWLRRQWDGQFIVKGVLEPADALSAMDAGADAVVVSNHGGNDLDTVLPSLAALPAVVAAIDGRIPVLFDGGIRRGADVVKALALGASSVLVGRAGVWATAARGERGLDEILRVFDRDIKQTLAALGVSSVAGLEPRHVVQDPYFAALSRAHAAADSPYPATYPHSS